MDLAGLDDLYPWLPGTPTEIAAEALRRASADFRVAVRHEVDAHTYEVVLDGTGSRVLQLPAAPVTGVESVEVDGEPVTDWRWSAAGLLERDVCWPRRYRSVAVTFTAGFDPIPDDVVSVVVERAVTIVTHEPGVRTIQVGGQSTTFTDLGTTTAWEACVARYRLNRGDAP